MKPPAKPFNDRRSAAPIGTGFRTDPHVILVAGYAGSGKTEFSRKLADRLSWPVVDKDTSTHALVDALSYRLTGDPDDRYSEVYLSFIRPLEYQALRDTVVDNVSLGLSVVVTAPYLAEVTDRQWVQRERQAFAALGARLVIAWVDADIPTMHQRISSRGASRDRWKLQNWPQYQASIDPVPYRAAADEIIDNTTTTFTALDQQADELAARLAVLARTPVQ